MGFVPQSNLPLLADRASEEINDLRPIRQSGITKNSSLNPWILDTIGEINLGLAQVNLGQICSSEGWPTHQSSSQICSTEIGTIQGAVSQIGVAEIGTTQVGFSQNSFGYNGMTEISTTKISFFQPSTPQISVTQVGTTQISPIQLSAKQSSASHINPWNFGILQLDASIKNDTAKISFPNSIALQQLLSSHNFNLQNTTVLTFNFNSWALKIHS